MTAAEQTMVVDEELMEDEGSGTKMRSDWSVDRRASIKSLMKMKKTDERFELDEDVYALIAICPVASLPFLFAIAIVVLKLVVYGILISGIHPDLTQPLKILNIETTVVKFLLIPVSVAMQEDLMSAFFFFANAIYCPRMLEVSTSATKSKLYFSYILRTIDGIGSLYVNLTVMLITEETLGVFLNFAALQFLQSIDDVFYELIEKGFLGDSMEHWAVLSAKVTIARRHGDDNKRILCFRISWLDTILMVTTVVLCSIGWVIFTVATYSEWFGAVFYGTNYDSEPVEGY